MAWIWAAYRMFVSREVQQSIDLFFFERCAAEHLFVFREMCNRASICFAFSREVLQSIYLFLERCASKHEGGRRIDTKSKLPATRNKQFMNFLHILYFFSICHIAACTMSLLFSVKKAYCSDWYSPLTPTTDDFVPSIFYILALFASPKTQKKKSKARTPIRTHNITLTSRTLSKKHIHVPASPLEALASSPKENIPLYHLSIWKTNVCRRTKKQTWNNKSILGKKTAD